MILWVECTECSPCVEMLVVLLNCNPLIVTSHLVKRWQQKALLCLSSTTSALLCSDMDLEMSSFFFNENWFLISSSYDDLLNFFCVYWKTFFKLSFWYAAFKHKYEGHPALNVPTQTHSWSRLCLQVLSYLHQEEAARRRTRLVQSNIDKESTQFDNKVSAQHL